MLTWELIGAVIGAGLASGREIASFFSRYGVWSYAGVVLSVGTMVFLADTPFQRAWRSSWQEKLWKILLSLLLIATGGAMLSGAGEMVSLILPLPGAGWIGTACTLCMAWMLAHRTADGLAMVSRGLLCVLAVLILLGFLLPPMKAAVINSEKVHQMPLRAIAYGGFNAALQRPIAEASCMLQRQRRRAVNSAGCIIAALLMLGNGLLLRHPALMAEEMPFIRMLAAFGPVGYLLGAVCLYLAILSTLTACMRGLGCGMHPAVCILVISFLGFSGVVEWLYPILGGGCFLMLAAAKFMNCSRKAFISPEDML